jgi:hypothetical protein
MDKMKKKLAIGILTGAIILGGAGTFAFAAANEDANGNGLLNFGQMKPFMEKMHPELSTDELKDMYNSCHGKGGMMDGDSTKGMMNGNTRNMMNNL